MNTQQTQETNHAAACPPLSVSKEAVDELARRLEWARQVINTESEPSDLVIAAHTILAELERLERGEFICRKCGLRKNDEHERGEF